MAARIQPLVGLTLEIVLQTFLLGHLACPEPTGFVS